MLLGYRNTDEWLQVLSCNDNIALDQMDVGEILYATVCIDKCLPFYGGSVASYLRVTNTLEDHVFPGGY